MKKIIFILFSFILYNASTAFGQTVNDVPISAIDVEYIQIGSSAKPFSSIITIQVDFGQKSNFMSTESTSLLDKEGSPMEFNSMIEALNFFSQSGYEYLDAYSISINNRDVVYYLLRKKKEEGK